MQTLKASLLVFSFYLAGLLPAGVFQVEPGSQKKNLWNNIISSRPSNPLSTFLFLLSLRFSLGLPL